MNDPEKNPVNRRVKTGIDGLDQVLDGGYPRGTNILVTGPSGTGKTIFCAQFIYKGLRDYNENGIFVTLEEKPKNLRKGMLSLGWDFKKYEDEGKLIIIDAASIRSGLATKEKYKMPKGFDTDNLLIGIHKAAKEIGATRIVVDSLPSLELHLNDTALIRKSIFRISSLLLETRMTSLLTTESLNSNMISRYGVEEFVCRGVITLDLEEKGKDLKRMLRVRKMRGTKHTMRKLSFEIQQDGILIFFN